MSERDKDTWAESDILERLQNYNPPDRTTARGAQTALDIQEAATEIAFLRRDRERMQLRIGIEKKRAELVKQDLNDMGLEIAQLKTLLNQCKVYLIQLGPLTNTDQSHIVTALEMVERQ